jgi:hypothetical protein
MTLWSWFYRKALVEDADRLAEKHQLADNWVYP